MASNCIYHSVVARYTCPNCGIKTCCIECVQQHKLDKDCSGKREIKFIKKQDLNRVAKEDLHFFQQIGDSIQLTKHIGKRSGNKRPIKKIAAICKPFRILWVAAPLGLDSSKLNQTRVKDESVFWSLKIDLNGATSLVHNINGLLGLSDVLTALDIDFSKTVLIYVHQKITNSIHVQTKWTNIPESRWRDSLFHSLAFGILPGEHVVIHEYPSLRIKVIE